VEKVPNKQVAGIKAYAEQKNKETIAKVHKAIDSLKRKKMNINFDSVSKEAGVSRATLYNNPQLKERILSLRAVSKGVPLVGTITVAKDKKQLQEEKIIALRQKVKQLEEDKAKLIAQLVEMEELKQENERLKNRKSSKS